MVVVTKRLLYRPQELWTSWDEWISRHGEGGKAVGSVGGMFEDYLPRQTGTVFLGFLTVFSVVVVVVAAAAASSRSHVGKTWNVHS